LAENVEDMLSDNDSDSGADDGPDIDDGPDGPDIDRTGIETSSANGKLNTLN
jgi:hypothetical protein